MKVAHSLYPLYRSIYVLQAHLTLPPHGRPTAGHRRTRPRLRVGCSLPDAPRVTGSGKTFTAANVIARLGKPTLVLSHNKTLAAQLYAEFKAFFPDNAVEYFVSYYDYYQPEAYIAASDTYIEKDMAINAEIEKLRLRATASLLSGREDVIVISSVSCLYGMADPKAFEEKILRLQEGQRYSQEQLKRDLVLNHYVNDRLTFTPGYFRVKGDTIDIFPSIEGFDGVAYRVTFWDDEIERIASFDPQSGREYGPMTRLIVHPANLFVTTQEQVNSAVGQIDVDLGQRVPGAGGRRPCLRSQTPLRAYHL